MHSGPWFMLSVGGRLIRVELEVGEHHHQVGLGLRIIFMYNMSI